MLCPIFSMVVSQKYVPSAVCYIWHPEMVPIGFDQPLFLILSESNFIEYEII